MTNFKDTRKQMALEMYENLPDDPKTGDLFDALNWARNTLRDHEGSGHQFYIHATVAGEFQCSFAKPEWGGDHCSDAYPEACQAIIMAVCEYLNGM